jgi:hypothetical protein
LNNENLEIINDVAVYIKGFDVFSKKRTLDIDVSRPIYDFNQADILVSEESLVLLGKATQSGTTIFASPVELVSTKPKTSIAKAKLVNWSDHNNVLQIEIEDHHYKTPIKIEFKSHHEAIKLWLSQYGPK